MKFDSISQQRIGLAGSVDPMGSLSMRYAAFRMYFKVPKARSNSLIGYESLLTLSGPCRDYYIHPDVARGVKLLSCHVEDIWDDILEDCGFDVDWVYEENERRKRVVLGESSAHDISVGPGTSRILDVRHRRVRWIRRGCFNINLTTSNFIEAVKSTGLV
ncbi:hypothetical protein F4814DRAFT_15683 [Daldinia grandis]|nr:hypothetical protein F4814DRAFT_15683 [Daldinia grandis]